MHASTLPASTFSRRSFLGRLGLGGSAALATTLPGFGQARGSAAPATFLASTDPETDLTRMSATKLAQLIREKRVTAAEAVDAHIRRITAVNPRLNAVVQTCFERAREEAAAADKALAAGRTPGPLHGVPMTIKDSIDTAGVVSTGGTIGRQDFIPPEDATVVARLRAAGAILLGKTNTPEWTLGGGGIPGIGTTANILYGISRNPYDTSRSTAGSSGGAGAIVAAGGASFDIGTDWGGSIRGPAHNNGIAGIKPTFGRVPRTGHIVDFGGMFDSWQQLGPMTRKVEDLVLILPIISGPDFRDAAIVPMGFGDPSKVEVKSLRVAWYAENGVAEVTPETIATIEACAKFLADAGCPVKQDFPRDIVMPLEETRFKLTRCVWPDLKRLAEKWGSHAVSPTITARYESELPTTSELTALLEQQDASRSRMLQWVRAYDIILNPVAGTPALPINLGVREWKPGGSFTGIHNTTGWPAVVVRAGTSPEGLPIGVQVIGQPWCEDKVFAAAAFLERRTGGWKPPAI